MIEKNEKKLNHDLNLSKKVFEVIGNVEWEIKFRVYNQFFQVLNKYFIIGLIKKILFLNDD